MDSVVGGIIGKLIEGYFSIFFVNFRKEDFQLNTGAQTTSTTIQNLEINSVIVQEIIGIPNFEVQKMLINSLTVSIQPTKIRTAPIVISIDRLDCIIVEPWEKLKPIPNVLEAFLKKLPQGKQSYGFSEKVIDGFTFNINHMHIEFITRGKYKTEQTGDWTPPPLHIDMKGISFYTTNARWEVVDLKAAREFNTHRADIHVFKLITMDSFNCAIVDGENRVDLLRNVKPHIQVVIRKKQDNTLEGVSLEVIFNNLNVAIRLENLVTIMRLWNGVAACFGRRDKPQEAAVKIPHPGRIVGLTLRDWSVVVLEAGCAKGLFLNGKDLRMGNVWPNNADEFSKQIEICVGSFNLREFFARNGPSPHYIIRADPKLAPRNLFNTIKPIQRTYHPLGHSFNPEAVLFYLTAVLGKPPTAPAYDTRLAVNPIQATVRPETIESLVEFLIACTPYLTQVQQLHAVKPEGDLKEVLLQEGKNPLEELIFLQATFVNFSLVFPSAENSSFVQVYLNVKETLLLSHPQLPETSLLLPGINPHALLSEAEDLLFSRNVIKIRDRLHVVRFKGSSNVEFTVQFHPDAEPQPALHLPNITLDLTVTLGDNLEVYDPSKPQPKKEILLFEATLAVGTIEGKITQHQYKALLSRIDQVLLLAPLLQKLSSVGRNIEKPTIPLIVSFTIDKGKWTLCNDYSLDDISKVGSQTPTIELLAGLEFHRVQVLFENSTKRQLLSAYVEKVLLDALPNPPNKSLLYNPNAFIQSGFGDKPLFVMRFEYFQTPPGDILIDPATLDSEDPLQHVAGQVRKYLSNRAFYDGKRSKFQLIVSDLHSGFNPNPACKIITFFLKSELNFKRMFATLQDAKKSLQLKKDELAQMANEMAEGFAQSLQSSFDIDILLKVENIQVFFVQDLPLNQDNLLNGNIELAIAMLSLDRHTEGKYIQHSDTRIQELALTCNKEENQKVFRQPVFTPISANFTTKSRWDTTAKEWIMEISGSFDRIDLGVNPAHANVFMDVVHGIKMQNIKEVVESISAFISQAKKELPALGDSQGATIEEVREEPVLDDASSVDVRVSRPRLALDSNVDARSPFEEPLEKLAAWSTKAVEQVATAKNEYSTLSASLLALEERTGQSDIIGRATIKGPLRMLDGKKLVKRYVALSKGGSLCVFVSESDRAPAAQIKITQGIELSMVQSSSLKNAFQVSHGQTKFILLADDELSMTKWVNELLRQQCAGMVEAQTSEALNQAEKSLVQIHQLVSETTSLVEQFKDQVGLLSRIKALEEMVRIRDEKIAALGASL